jgi:DNA polymerase I-like protein with 3'-5' exonuclease and polymerase domains
MELNNMTEDEMREFETRAVVSEKETGDIYSEVAARVFKCNKSEVTKEQRRSVKSTIFGTYYGSGGNNG